MEPVPRVATGLVIAALALWALAACSDAQPRVDAGKTGAAPTPPDPAPPTPAPPPAAAPIAGLREVALPAAPGSTSPSVAVGHDGRLYVVWLEPVGPDDFALRLARHGTEGWSDVQTVAEGESLLANWADVPRVATIADGTIVVTWPERVARGPGDHYRTRLARSSDGGERFDAPIDLHGTASGPEFGFVSLVPEGAKAVRAYWLDGREVEAGAPTQLWTAEIERRGKPRGARVLDPDVCDCCQTSGISSAVGPLVAYRDRTEDEVRDIRVAGGPLPTGGVAVHDDGWNISGCPVNGPAIAAHERELAVAWFSGQTPPGRVDVAFTADPNRFGSPIRVDAGHPLGRVDLQLLDDGSAIVTWMESMPEQPTLAQTRARRVHKDGRMGEPLQVAVTTGSRDAGFPHAVIVEDRMLWVWTDPGQQGMSKVRAAEAPLSALQ